MFKAGLLIVVWSGGALVGELVTTWLGLDVDYPWLYQTLQMLIFLIAVGLLLW